MNLMYRSGHYSQNKTYCKWSYLPYRTDEYVLKAFTLQSVVNNLNLFNDNLIDFLTVVLFNTYI